ncbi:hypothetical protein AVEN_106100-1 [Araneus ventricosus]|uniref:Uncharacterized protein n=1 Tax=Araneus ventricosus TaxID=182803 RepID=A0A4Y2HUC6_ARAVE|nr:hypothetical protein AVEN_106100-1 [Araneus ventricosus]
MDKKCRTSEDESSELNSSAIEVFRRSVEIFLPCLASTALWMLNWIDLGTCKLDSAIQILKRVVPESWNPSCCLNAQ